MLSAITNLTTSRVLNFTICTHGTTGLRLDAMSRRLYLSQKLHVIPYLIIHLSKDEDVVFYAAHMQSTEHPYMMVGQISLIKATRGGLLLQSPPTLHPQGLFKV